MRLTLKGRIENWDFDQATQSYFTTIILPADDAYSRPNAFRGRSPHQLGAVGSEITVDALMTGAVHLEKWIDKKTGQPRQMYKGTVYFEFHPAQVRAMPQPLAAKG